MLLVASKNIRKGEEISDNYCIHFSDMKTRERREWLEVSILNLTNKKLLKQDIKILQN